MTAFLNVIIAELFKAIHKRRLYVIAALQWVLLPALVLLVGQIIKSNVLGTDFDQGGVAGSAVQEIASPFGIARLGLLLPSVISPTFYIITIALLAALFIGEERSQNMWKTTLVAQPNRLAVLSGKFVVAMLFFGALLLGNYLMGLIFGGIGTLFLPTTFAGNWMGLLQLYLLQWLFGAAAMAFAFLMVWLIRNNALGMVSIFFIPALLEGIYFVYKTTVGFERLNRFNVFFQGLRLKSTLEDLPKYFFTYNLYTPSRKPLTEVVSSMGGDVTSSSDFGFLSNFIGANITLPHSAMVMAGYFVLFSLVLWWSFQRKDVS
jgi:ABC-type transport system involved in multi-copper enzyme maturation permease subunit